MSTAEAIELAPEPAPPPLPEPMITDDALYERIDGARVEMPRMSVYANQVAADLADGFRDFLRQNRMGRIYPEMLFRLSLPNGRVRDRRPDLAYVSFDRSSPQRAIDPYQSAWDIVPDLAVEVVSPSDLFEDLRAKVLEYFAAGVRQVWVISPINRVADVFEAPDLIRVVTEDADLQGGDVLPGFRLRLGSLFDPMTTRPSTD